MTTHSSPTDDRAVLGGEHRAVQDAAAGADPDVAGQHRGGRDGGRRIDHRAMAAMLDQHGRRELSERMPRPARPRTRPASPRVA